MKSKKWCIALAGLMVAAMMTLADISFAQPRGQGMGRRGQGNQAWMQGWGPGNPNCPNYPGYRNWQQGRANNPQARRGRRWNQSFNPSVPQGAVILPETAQ